MRRWQNAIERNWKTTLCGTISAISAFIAFSPNHFGGNDSLLVNLAQFVTAGGLFSLGIVGKDFDKTGTR